MSDEFQPFESNIDRILREESEDAEAYEMPEVLPEHVKVSRGGCGGVDA